MCIIFSLYITGWGCGKNIVKPLKYFFLLLLILFTGIKYLYFPLKIAFSVIDYFDLYILGKNEHVILLISVLFC